MSRQTAFAVLLVAALATGRAVQGLMPAETAASEPFERAGAVGEPIETRWGTVEVTAVDGSTRIVDSAGTGRISAGVYVVVDWTYTAAGEPQIPAYVAIRDGEGRVFRSGSQRNPYSSGGAAQPGITRQLATAIEVPADAVAGAHLVIALPDNDEDHRRDDIAVVDLGLTADDAEAYAAAEEPLEVADPVDGGAS
ncbi:hypothetical protein [Jiangella mangrovi]|uniref:DUF4352 domain-containing protein n=1 Tax=Jiangella mangrovi TaxID=1524084 RepID=A0A7W9GUQ7_9ACTN|nr:hypothetical protein [Jiangella mangrovi]MBB5790066.1 hypothetical protein [Jiangella mangrovi]